MQRHEQPEQQRDGRVNFTVSTLSLSGGMYGSSKNYGPDIPFDSYRTMITVTKP